MWLIAVDEKEALYIITIFGGIASPICNLIYSIILWDLINQFFVRIILFLMILLTITFFIYFPYLILQWWRERPQQGSFDVTDVSDVPGIYRIPYISQCNPGEISYEILFVGQFLYSFIYVSYVFLGYLAWDSVLAILFYVYVPVALLFLYMFIEDFMREYKRSKRNQEGMKKEVSGEIHRIFYEEDEKNFAELNFYLQIALELRKLPVINVKFISKLLTFITILIAFIPLIFM